MSRHLTLLPLIFLLAPTAALQAQPLDSPDVVYIDGQPCSRACQVYMDWTNRALSARRHEQREVSVAAPPEAEFERIEPVARPRTARQAATTARTAPLAGKAASNSGTAAPSALRVMPRARPPGMAAATPAQTAALAAPPPVAAPAPAAPAPELEPAAKPEAVVPPSAKLDVAAAPAAPTAATASQAREIGKAASASLDDPDNLVALVLAGPGIDSLSDLNNKNIAIAEKQSASSGRVSAALMAAGAAEVQFSEGKASALDRLMNGEVPAAVVLAPREVANLFPEVEGFRTFRVPLKAKM